MTRYPNAHLCPPKLLQCLLRRSLSWAALLTVLAGCATSPSAKPNHTAALPQPYMRIAYPDADTVQFQIAVRRFVPTRGRGPDLWLAGASHVGEPAYYDALQRHLDTQPLVLFEGIKDLSHPASGQKARSVQRAEDSAETLTASKASPASSLQVTLAKSLGLVFQLEAIDYDRPNFRNSDLSAQQIQALMLANRSKVPGEERTNQETEFQDLVETMQGTSAFGAILKAVLDIIGNSPRLQALTKLALIEVLGEFKGDITQIQALPPDMKRLFDVLIQERNKAVLADLKAELKSRPPPASITVLFGAAHLYDLEQRLRRELKYRPADQLWLPVFSVNTRKAGLSELEIGLVKMIVRMQLQEFKPAASRP